MWKQPARLRRIGISVAALAAFALVAAELVGRFAFGLGSPPLVEPSAVYGYRFRPDQDLRRFGHRVFYNHYGLRSEPIAAAPAPGVTRVLCVGDSVTNGGALTDQAQTYPYLLADLLGASGQDRYEVLNASAGSWGIGNMLAYLGAEGTYASRVIVIELGTHDLWQQASTAESVGTRDMPDRRPVLALQEVFTRYLPRFLPTRPPAATAGGPSQPPPAHLERNLADLERLVALVRSRGAQPVVMLVPEPRDLDAVPEYVADAERQLARRLAAGGVAYRWLLEDFREAREGGAEPLFRDDVHPTPAGNAVMARRRRT